MKYKIVFYITILTLLVISIVINFNARITPITKYKKFELAAISFIHAANSSSRFFNAVDNYACQKFFFKMSKNKILNNVDSTTSQKTDGILYKNKILNEKVYINANLKMKYHFFKSRGLFENIFFSSNYDEKVLKAWPENFHYKDNDVEKDIFSVCFLLKSGLVLQILDINEFEVFTFHQGKKNYKVVRIFFLGEKFKKDFPKAYIVTEKELREKFPGKISRGNFLGKGTPISFKKSRTYLLGN